MFCKASKNDNDIGTARKADCLMAGLGVQRDVEEAYNILYTAAIEDRSGKKDSCLAWFHSTYDSLIETLLFDSCFVSTCCVETLALFQSREGLQTSEEVIAFPQR